ncbi:bifunctional UDP-sugar hydrolase/5'-nucleotidase [Shewanella sp. 202IG2-18]|uniref:bifunctional UDP-sugar hydrolase/5'-nucleotidase UshA n=1 Tax=Parashewanella hymeniacidonis TaxID=2807618 RepID=UPI00195F56D2|nr:bifunctional UDP-sugar hydrolase/5'-nucleotidase UshA [Parashewanella hymeniacidonis]MBM7073692.1 bifunctional UDP-sugar hydrolase/5'-nucleotidase [Parashewanella hymeniacidonis]
MSNKLVKGLVASAVLAALTGCGSDNKKETVDPTPTPVTCAEAGDACVKFTVLHTNDNHGRFWENKNGEYGMAARKTLIDNLRAEIESEGGTTLLLSGGDVNTGVPESDLQDARPDFIGMNLMEYDAMAVGNHEFDNHLDVVEMQRKLANFPMLAANIYETETDDDGKETLVRYFDAYKVFELNGLRVAVVGLTTKDTVKIGNPEFISELTFTDPAEEMKKVIAEIKAGDKADLIFATTHMGHFKDGQHGSNAPGDVKLALAQEAGDLSAIIGGHSQNPVCMENYDGYKPGEACTPDQQNGTFIMQAHEWGKYVGRADFEYFNDELHLSSYELVPVNLKVKNEAGERVLVGDAITPDATVREILRPYQEQGQAQLDIAIAKTNGKLEGERAVVRKGQTNLGHLLAQAQREVYAGEPADFSVMNSGGVRASIEAGDVSYRDVLTVQPFGNKVMKFTMNGADVASYMNTVARVDIGAKGSGAYPQLVGIKMTVNCTAEDNGITIHEINGKDFDAAAMYSFTVPSFNAAGGDGYPPLIGDTAFDSLVMTPDAGHIDEQALKAYFERESENNTVTIDVSESSKHAPVAADLVFENTLDSTGKACLLPTAG